MTDFIGDLIDRHNHVYSKTEIRFKSWRASMNPVHFGELMELLTNSILFGVTSSTQTLVIVGQKFTGKTTLTKQILEYVPNLHIVDSYEPIPDHFCIHLLHQFFNHDDYQQYFSMPEKKLYLGNPLIFDDACFEHN